MAFSLKNWKNKGETPTTPISASSLKDVEKRVTDYSDTKVPTGNFGGANTSDQLIATSTGWQGLAPTTINPKDPAFGATGAGITSDAVALKAALAYVVTLGGGTVALGPGIYAINEYIDIPTNVNLKGIASGAVTIKCLNSTSGIRFGHEKPVGAGNRGGLSGGFTINGNSVATIGIQIASIQRMFTDLYIENVNGDGLVVNWAQNNTFGHINIERCAGNGIVWDFGCESNLFQRIEIYQCSKWGLLARASSEEVLSAKEPRYNLVEVAVIEHPGTTVGGGTVGVAEGLVNFEGGIGNEITRATVSAISSSAAMPLIASSKAKSFAFSARNKINNCVLTGVESLTTGIRGGANSSLILGGRVEFENLKTAWELADTFKGEIDITPEYSAVTAEFANYESGTSNLNALVMTRTYNMRTRVTVPTANTNPVYEILATGDTRGRLTLNASGQIQLGSGSATPDWLIRRNGSETARIEGRLEVTKAMQSLAAANEITVGGYARLVQISGTTEIKKIIAGVEGQEVTLKFAEALTIKDGENLKLAGDFVTTGDDTLTLICNGTNWYEICRSVN